jgi:hypothetical protein
MAQLKECIMTLSLLKLEKAIVVDSSHKAVEGYTLADAHNAMKVKRLLSEVQQTYLDVTWSVSKARDTYGYNRVTVRDVETGKRFVECGGGFDMLGSALGQWLQVTCQELLLCHSDLAYGLQKQGECGKWSYTTNEVGRYGMTLNIDKQGVKSITLDGGCGLESMLRIVEAIGIKLQRVNTYNKRGQNTGVKGWYVSVKELQA